MADVTEEHANIWILPLQERHPCGSFPKRQLHLAGRRNQIRQTPAQCWQTLQNLLRSSKSHEKKNDEIFYSEEVSIIVLFLGSYDYHEISVGDMMFDETSSENNHSCALGKHGLAVQPPNIWSIQNCHNEMTNGFCEIISRLTHPPQCQALVQGSYMSGSRSYHPMSRQWGRD